MKKEPKERNIPFKERKRTEPTKPKRTRCPTLAQFQQMQQYFAACEHSASAAKFYLFKNHRNLKNGYIFFFLLPKANQWKEIRNKKFLKTFFGPQNGQNSHWLKKKGRKKYLSFTSFELYKNQRRHFPWDRLQKCFNFFIIFGGIFGKSKHFLGSCAMLKTGLGIRSLVFWANW